MPEDYWEARAEQEELIAAIWKGEDPSPEAEGMKRPWVQEGEAAEGEEGVGDEVRRVGRGGEGGTMGGWEGGSGNGNGKRREEKDEEEEMESVVARGM